MADNTWHFSASNIEELITAASLMGDDDKAYLTKEQVKRAVTELTTLKAELASYSGSCASGSCSIWSLSMENHDGRKKMITIEVDKSGHICQMRGKANRGPDAREMSVIQRWCTQEGISVRSWKGW